MKTKHITPIAAAFLLALTSAQAQTTMPYYTGFDDATQQQGWATYRKGDTPFFNWMYEGPAQHTGPKALFHHYPVGGSQVTDDWHVSPSFNFSNGGKIDSLRFHFGGFGSPATADTIAIYLLTGSPDPALASGKTLLLDFRGTDYQNDETWRMKTNIVIPAAPGLSYLAFRYKTVVNWLDVSFDNLAVDANLPTAITEDESQLVSVYPNPAATEITVQTEGAGLPAGELVFSLYNPLGKLVLQQVIKEQNTQLKLKQSAGAYFFQITSGDSKSLKSGKLLVK